MYVHREAILDYAHGDLFNKHTHNLTPNQDEVVSLCLLTNQIEGDCVPLINTLWVFSLSRKYNSSRDYIVYIKWNSYILK